MCWVNIIISLLRLILEDAVPVQQLEAVVAYEAEGLAAFGYNCCLRRDVDVVDNGALDVDWTRSEAAEAGILHALQKQC